MLCSWQRVAIVGLDRLRHTSGQKQRAKVSECAVPRCGEDRKCTERRREGWVSTSRSLLKECAVRSAGDASVRPMTHSSVSPAPLSVPEYGRHRLSLTQFRVSEKTERFERRRIVD